MHCSRAERGILGTAQTETERETAQQGGERQVERGNKTRVRTSRGATIWMKRWTDGSGVRTGFVSTIFDCTVGLLYLVVSKEGLQ